MIVKKIFKAIGSVILLLILLMLIFLIVIFAVHSRKNKTEFTYLERLGYANTVTARDYKINVCSYGNEKGKHKLVALSDYGVYDYSVTLRKVTDEFADDNLIIFPDRAGYGLSEDTSFSMTTKNIVENYRTALKNAGFEAPYVLLPHSLGGVYATYWESTYPEEIEGVVFLDGTQLSKENKIEDSEENSSFNDTLYMCASKMGLHRLVFHKYWYYLPDNYTEQDQKLSDDLGLHNGQSRALNTEKSLLNDNCAEAFRSIVKNDIPKVYINASWGMRTDEDFDEAWNWAYAQSQKTGVPMTAPNDAEYREMRSAAVRQAKELTEKELLPYLELMGNCECIDLPGDHYIFEQKPEECVEIIREFLNKL